MINSLIPNGAHIGQSIRLSVVMTFRMPDAKPLPDPMLTCFFFFEIWIKI